MLTYLFEITSTEMGATKTEYKKTFKKYIPLYSNYTFM